MNRHLVVEAQDSNVERCRKVVATVQDAIQCCRIMYDKKATTQPSLDHVFRRVERIESSMSDTSGHSSLMAEDPSCSSTSDVSRDPSLGQI